MLTASLLVLLNVYGVAAIVLPPPTPTTPPNVRLQERGVVDDLSKIFSEATVAPADVTKWVAALPSDIAGGILPQFENLPDSDAIKKQLQLNDDQINALPVNILNIPSYGNFSDQWHVRVHGQAYRQPPATDAQLDEASKAFLPDLDVSTLNATELAESRNMTASLMAIPVEGVQLAFSFVLDGQVIQNFTFPNLTDPRGEFDALVPLSSNQVSVNSEKVKKLDIFSLNSTSE